MKRIFSSKKLASLNAQTIFSLVSIFILDAITYITNPVFANLLSQEAYGIVSLYSSYREVIMVIFGLQTLGSISYAAVHFKDGEYEKYCSCALTLSSLSFIVCSALTIALMNPVSVWLDLPSALIPFLVIQSFGNYIISFNSYRLIYKKQAGKSALISGIVSLSSAAVSIALVLIFKYTKGYDGYWGRIIGVFAPNIIVGLVLLILMFVHSKPNFDRRFLKICLIVSLPMIFHRLGQIFLARTDVFMINSMISADEAVRKSQVAIYYYANSMASVLAVIFNAMNNTWVAFLFEDFKQGNTERIRKRAKNYLHVFTALTFGFLTISPEVITWFVPTEYHYGVNLIPFMVVSTYLTFIYSFYVNIEVYHAKTVYTMAGTITSAGINVVLNYFLIRAYGLMGAVVATAISYGLLFLFHFIICKIRYRSFCVYAEWYFLLDAAIVAGGVVLAVLLKDYMWARWPFGFVALAYLIVSIARRKSIF